ncbi:MULTISPECIES: citrate lyase acyl carrier protein [Cetobacterium]|jgi:citrate lyase subunit gamma (acyl carrier protein)|uniref:Citrate lyase acyl carrier protein n=2 Tax=Cetobacterium TaxID=180162 RepID=U7VEP1_9FUSO|nr:MULTISPECIES: citrate lyase acyl carrier protein [Cetobacterium]ERT69614.1 citrate lyase acyl carrier protein [Cetobacterium somerae ATCC BAA-474]MBC2852666.1 citrate lyase acyl carrier protein [Cetobacterium sp. 2G large]MCQ8211971.1 citrate lyase acyl carrier protein [Cetobacterium sp. NK01]MCQ9627394.1 citrate lyase acyl carrier protein [Cetobacterium somerae]MCX3068231.1 citrate lyase acyl carrier protein [Cetobacterium somerae]
MEIKVKAVAGTLESSDMYVIIEPNATGIELEIESVVMGQYGDDVRRVILESLEELGVTSAKVLVNDKGAIEPVIKSRIQTVVTRAAQQKFTWK